VKNYSGAGGTSSDTAIIFVRVDHELYPQRAKGCGLIVWDECINNL